MTFRKLRYKLFPKPTPVIDLRVFQVKCKCGHILDRHNDKEPFDVDNWFQGNCRMCSCQGFEVLE